MPTPRAAPHPSNPAPTVRKQKPRSRHSGPCTTVNSCWPAPSLMMYHHPPGSFDRVLPSSKVSRTCTSSVVGAPAPPPADEPPPDEAPPEALPPDELPPPPVPSPSCPPTPASNTSSSRSPHAARLGATTRPTTTESPRRAVALLLRLTAAIPPPASPRTTVARARRRSGDPRGAVGSEPRVPAPPPPRATRPASAA